jgi:hypothetical protein
MVDRKRAAGRRFELLPLALFLIVQGAGASAAQQRPGMLRDLHGRMSGWRIDNVAEDDGGRIVRMTRVEGPYRLAYAVSFWRGNAGPYARASVELPDRSCGEREWHRDPDRPGLWRPETNLAARARAVRSHLTASLVACGVPPAGIARALRGFDAAFALTARWAELARRDTLAEMDWISRGH